MSVTVISGRSGSGKSRVLAAHIKKLIKDPLTNIIVMVPGQLTFETEKNIMQSCGVAGILGLQVMSAQRLAFKIINETGSVSFISSAQKTVIAGRALAEEGTYAIEGMEECAAELMARLKSFCQTPESLRSAAADITDTELKKKLLTSANLYERYIELCAGRPDLSDIYSIAAACAAKAEFLKGAQVVIDGLDSASPAVMAMLTEVMRLSSDTVAAFRGGADGEGDLFSSEERDMRRFIKAAKSAGKSVERIKADEPARYGCAELEYLEKNLFRYPYEPYEGDAPNIRLYEAQSIEDEADALAEGIIAQVRGGRRFCDIAVVGGGVEAYLPAIKEKFAERGIAWFFDERRTLADNSFFEFLHDAASAAAGDMTAVEGYIYSCYSPLDEAERRELKVYAKRYALKGWHYKNKFARANAERAEALRQKAMRPLQRLSRGILVASAKEQTQAIKRLLDDCGAGERLEAFCAAIDSGDTRAEHGYFSQVWERSAEVLDGISEAYGEKPIEPRTLPGVLKSAFRSTKIALIPPSTDEVGIYDISVARLPGIEVLFAVGVHDGVWPAKDDGAGIMSRSERDALLKAGLDIGPYDASAEKLKVYTALCKPKRRLYVSFNTQTGQPSVIVDRIKRLFPKAARTERLPAAGEAGALGALASSLAGADMEPAALACAALLKRPGWKERARGILLRTNAAVPIGKDGAAALYGGIRCSATRIEDYYRCPFRHFLDFGIKAQPERDYITDVVDAGTYMHLALDIFTKRLLEDGADIKLLSEQQTERRMDEAAREAAKRHDGGKLISDERFALRAEMLNKELVSTAQRIREHFTGCGASIILSEQEFLDYTVETEYGEVTITGKIDRIDAAGGYFRVVDYKSSSSEFSLKDFAAGVRIQLPVYISAAKRLLEKQGRALEPAGGYYMRIGDAYQGSKEAVAKEARLSGISLCDTEALVGMSAVNDDNSFAAIDQALKISGELKKSAKSFTREQMDELLLCADGLIKSAAEQIYGGGNAISPAQGITGGDACAYCGYASVCRMDAQYSGNAPRQAEQLLFEEGGDCDELE